MICNNYRLLLLFLLQQFLEFFNNYRGEMREGLVEQDQAGGAFQAKKGFHNSLLSSGKLPRPALLIFRKFGKVRKELLPVDLI